MSGLIFNEESVLSGNAFKFESRLKNQTNKFIGTGALLSTYFHIHESVSTVDRGLQDIEHLFGHHSPLRFNRINNLPLCDFGQANPNNTDDSQIEDINIEGDCMILPGTIVPHPNDFFMLNHLSMRAFFMVVEVMYDAMKPEGYYRIRYRLYSTSVEVEESLNAQTVNTFNCQLDALGTDVNPILSVEDSIRREKVELMIAGMIDDYRALFYNYRHNCFLYDAGPYRWFDMCGNEFIAKHSLMNVPNSTDLLMLQHKIDDSRFPILYQQSIYRWIEDHAPPGMIQHFYLEELESSNYLNSSFARWYDNDVKVLVPWGYNSHGPKQLCVLNTTQLNFFDRNDGPGSNDIDNLLYLYISGKLDTIYQIPLTLGNSLRAAIHDAQSFFMTPIAIYIMRQVLKFN